MRKRHIIVDVFCISLLFILFLISIRALVPQEFISYWDWLGLSQRYHDTKSVWNPTSLEFGARSPSYYLIFSWPLLRLLDTRRVSNFWVIMPLLIGLISSYLVARRITGSLIASFVSSIIYSFNPTILTRYLQAHIGILVGYALFPFLLLSALILFDQKQLFSRRMIYFFTLAIIISFISALQVHFLLLAFLLLAVYVVLHAIMVRSGIWLLKNLAVLLGIFSLVLVLILPLTFNVLIFSRFNIAPSLVSVDHVYSLSQETYFGNLFRLIGESGPGFLSDVGYYANPLWTLLGFLMPIMAFAIFLSWRRGYRMFNAQRRKSTENRQLIIFLSILALLGIFLSTGTTYFPKLYLWLYLHIPFFYAFRESSKFLILTSLAYSLLVGIAVRNIGLRIEYLELRNKRKPALRSRVGRIVGGNGKLLVAIPVIVGQLAFSWPMLTGDLMIYSLHPKYEISEDLHNLGRWLDSQKEFFRVMILPYDDFMFHIWRHISSKPVVSVDMASLGASPGAYQYTIFAHGALYQGKIADLAKLLALTSTKYVMTRDNVPKTKSFYTSERFDFSSPKFKKMLSSSEDFEEIQNFGDYTVYKNKDFKKHVFGIEKRVLAIGDRQLLTPFTHVPGLEDSNSGLVFANQLSDIKDLEMFDTIITNSDLKDLEFILLDDEYKLNGYEYAKNITTGEDPKASVQFLWLRSDIYEYVTGGVFGNGAMPYGNGYAITEGQAQLVLPYVCSKPGEYEMWLRVLYAPNSGKMTISIDDNTVVNSFSLESPYFRGFKWTRLKGSVELGEGKHTVSVVNFGSQNAIDQIALVPKSIIPSLEDRVRKIITKKKLIYLYEAERVVDSRLLEASHSEDIRMVGLNDASGGEALTLKGIVTAQLEVPLDAEYRVLMRAKSGSDNGILVKIDNNSQEIVLQKDLKWYKLESIKLSQGKHDIALTGKATVDLIGLSLANEGQLANGPTNNQNAVSLDFQQINPTKYVVQYESTEPFLMILNESYHPLWRAYIDDKEIESISTNSYANGFHIKTPLKGEAVIEFVEQRYINMAFWISGGTLCGIIGLMLFLKIKRT